MSTLRDKPAMMADPEDALVQRIPAADVPSARVPSPDSDADAVVADPSPLAPQDQLARSIIRSKVQPPPVRQSTLERPRLLQWLGAHTADRLTLISAEAGYGKTTLLADFARRTTTRCVWYRLDPSDRDGLTFVSYLVAAVREIKPDFGEATSILLAQVGAGVAPLDAAVDSFVSELPSVGGDATLLMLDDFHAIDDVPAIQAILARLFEHAPSNVNFLLASRVRPTLRVARLAAHGQVARLETEDLRFSSSETADLFAVAYQLPLEPDLVEEIDARAEGWVASLQLVYSSIRDRRPSEARAFIQSLSGAEGALYDYLAEEVLANLAAPLQRVLVRASLLERVVPAYVLAILSTEPNPPTARHLAVLLDDAEALGLIGRPATGSSTRRFHPLLRDYLRKELSVSSTPESLRAMHLEVARAAEDLNDWVIACDHLIEADEPDEAMRVLAASATTAQGSGALETSIHLIQRAATSHLPTGARVLQARHYISIGDAASATEVLDQLDTAKSGPTDRALASLAHVHAAFRSGRTDLMEHHLDSLLRDADLPANLIDIGRAWRAMLDACRGGEIGMASRTLRELGDIQAVAGHHYFAGISYHNAGLYELAKGDFLSGLRLADQTLAQFQTAGGDSAEELSSRALVATAALELGHFARADEETRRLLGSDGADADAYADCAWNAAMTGDLSAAVEFLRKAERSALRTPGDLGMIAFLNRSRLMIAMTQGHGNGLEGISDDTAGFALEPDFLVRNWIVQGIHSVLADVDAERLLRRARRFAASQHAERALARIDVIEAASQDDSVTLVAAITRAQRSGTLAILEVADVICTRLHLFDSPPQAVLDSIQQWPDRWLPALRRQLTQGNTPSAHAAARLLSQFGRLSDVSRLVAFEKSYLRATRHRDLSKPLILKASPQLIIHDLGRSVLEVGLAKVDLVDARRRAASLLMYLVTRPRASATREQVTEELWPDLDPGSATNSLNQTLYFLRRDIDPWYDESTSANYVVNESELLWLDSRLVSIDSARFLASASETLRRPSSADSLAGLVLTYPAMFAPEFEYEEWAIDWRERVHAIFLMLVAAAERALAKSGEVSRRVELLLHALAVDPSALEVEAALIKALRALKAEAAATEQYSHFARAYRGDLGLEPPSLESLRD